MTLPSRRARWCAPAAAVLALLVSCSNGMSTATSTTITSPTTATTTSSVLPNSASTSTGLTDDELIAIARAALHDNGEPVSDDREPVVKRSDTGAEVAFPTRSDLPPRIGGEPHVFLDPYSGTVLRLTHTR